MVIVGKHINDISINPLEYLLGDATKEPMEFETEAAAKEFLKEKGFTDNEFEDLVFETASASNKKNDFMEAYGSINKIEDLLTEAGELFDRIPPAIQSAILAYHNEPGTVQHCLRWGLQAIKEIRKDWHTVVADISCEE